MDPLNGYFNSESLTILPVNKQSKNNLIKQFYDGKTDQALNKEFEDFNLHHAIINRKSNDLKSQIKQAEQFFQDQRKQSNTQLSFNEANLPNLSNNILTQRYSSLLKNSERNTKGSFYNDSTMQSNREIINATNHLKNIHKLRNRINNQSQQYAKKEQQKLKQVRDGIKIPTIQLNMLNEPGIKMMDQMNDSSKNYLSQQSYNQMSSGNEVRTEQLLPSTIPFQNPINQQLIRPSMHSTNAEVSNGINMSGSKQPNLANIKLQNLNQQYLPQKTRQQKMKIGNSFDSGRISYPNVSLPFKDPRYNTTKNIPVLEPQQPIPNQPLSQQGISPDLFFYKRLSQNNSNVRNSVKQPSVINNLNKTRNLTNYGQPVTSQRGQTQDMRQFNKTQNHIRDPIQNDSNQLLGQTVRQGSTQSVQYDLNGRIIKKTEREDQKDENIKQQQLIEQQYAALNQNYDHLFKQKDKIPENMEGWQNQPNFQQHKRWGSNQPRIELEPLNHQQWGNQQSNQRQNQQNFNNKNQNSPQNNMLMLSNEQLIWSCTSVSWPDKGIKILNDQIQRNNKNNKDLNTKSWDFENDEATKKYSKFEPINNNLYSHTGFNKSQCQTRDKQERRQKLEQKQSLQKQKTQGEKNNQARSYANESFSGERQSSQEDIIEQQNNQMLMQVLLNNLKRNQKRKQPLKNSSRIKDTERSKRFKSIRKSQKSKTSSKDSSENVPNVKIMTKSQQCFNKQKNKVNQNKLSPKIKEEVKSNKESSNFKLSDNFSNWSKNSQVQDKALMKKAINKNQIQETSKQIQALLQKNKIFEGIDSDQIQEAMQSLLKQKEKQKQMNSSPKLIKPINFSNSKSMKTDIQSERENEEPKIEDIGDIQINQQLQSQNKAKKIKHSGGSEEGSGKTNSIKTANFAPNDNLPSFRGSKVRRALQKHTNSQGEVEFHSKHRQILKEQEQQNDNAAASEEKSLKNFKEDLSDTHHSGSKQTKKTLAQVGETLSSNSSHKDINLKNNDQNNDNFVSIQNVDHKTSFKEDVTKSTKEIVEESAIMSEEPQIVTIHSRHSDKNDSVDTQVHFTKFEQDLFKLINDVSGQKQSKQQPSKPNRKPSKQPPVLTDLKYGSFNKKIGQPNIPVFKPVQITALEPKQKNYNQIIKFNQQQLKTPIKQTKEVKKQVPQELKIEWQKQKVQKMVISPLTPNQNKSLKSFMDIQLNDLINSQLYIKEEQEDQLKNKLSSSNTSILSPSSDLRKKQQSSNDVATATAQISKFQKLVKNAVQAEKPQPTKINRQHTMIGFKPMNKSMKKQKSSDRIIPVRKETQVNIKIKEPNFSNLEGMLVSKNVYQIISDQLHDTTERSMILHQRVGQALNPNNEKAQKIIKDGIEDALSKNLRNFLQVKDNEWSSETVSKIQRKKLKYPQLYDDKKNIDFLMEVNSNKILRTPSIIQKIKMRHFEQEESLKLESTISDMSKFSKQEDQSFEISDNEIDTHSFRSQSRMWKPIHQDSKFDLLEDQKVIFDDRVAKFANIFANQKFQEIKQKRKFPIHLYSQEEIVFNEIEYPKKQNYQSFEGSLSQSFELEINSSESELQDPDGIPENGRIVQKEYCFFIPPNLKVLNFQSKKTDEIISQMEQMDLKNYFTKHENKHLYKNMMVKLFSMNNNSSSFNFTQENFIDHEFRINTLMSKYKQKILNLNHSNMQILFRIPLTKFCKPITFIDILDGSDKIKKGLSPNESYRLMNVNRRLTQTYLVGITESMIDFFWGNGQQRLRQFLRKSNAKPASGAYDSCSSDEDTYNNQQNIHAAQGLAYALFPIDKIFQAKNSGFEIFKILSQTKLDKLGNNLDKQQSTDFTRERIRMINERFDQMQEIAKKRQIDPLPDLDSDLSSDLNFSDSLEQKANYIYVEHLQYQHELRKLSKDIQQAPKSSRGEPQSQSKRSIQPVYPFRYGEKQAKGGKDRQRGSQVGRISLFAEATRAPVAAREASDDEEMSNHNLYMLNNGLHLDLDADLDVDVDLNCTKNVAVRSRKAKDAQALQRYYDQIKAHVRTSKKGKSVFRFMRKRCLKEKEINNILTLDVKHLEANEYQKDVIIKSRLKYQAISINLTKRPFTKYVNPFRAHYELKAKLFKRKETPPDQQLASVSQEQQQDKDEEEQVPHRKLRSAQGPRKRVRFDLSPDKQESPENPPPRKEPVFGNMKSIGGPNDAAYNANSFDINIRMKEYNNFNNTESDQELKEEGEKMQASKGNKCSNFKLICKLQSLGDLCHFRDLQQELACNKVENVLECKSILHPDLAYPIYMMFEVIHVQRKTVQDQMDERKQLSEGMNKLVYLGYRVD